MSVNSAKNLNIKYRMSWFKSDPAKVAAREAEKAAREAEKAAREAEKEMNEIFYRGRRQGGIGPADLKRAMELFDKLTVVSSVDFFELFSNIMYMRNGKIKLVKKLIDKVKELGVDFPLDAIEEDIQSIPKLIKLMENAAPEKYRAEIEDERKTLLVLKDYAKYLRGENDNSGANAPAASMKPANAPNAPNAPLNQVKLEDGLQHLKMDLTQEGTSLNFIVDKEKTPLLHSLGKAMLTAPAAGGMRSKKRRNSKTKKGRSSKSKTPRKAKQ